MKTYSLGKQKRYIIEFDKDSFKSWSAWNGGLNKLIPEVERPLRERNAKILERLLVYQ